MGQTPWTRLEGSPLWTAAAMQYARNGHAYHNMDHVRRIYGHAERMGLIYDLRLDRAILGHDVILDGKPDPELRSADWLDAHLDAPDPGARKLILTTIHHDARSPDRRMAFLDLADFIDLGQTRVNSRLLRDEAARAALLRGESFDQKAWVGGTLGYLQGLQGRIRPSIPEFPFPFERSLWTKIHRGIAVTMATLPLTYAPHPASGIQRYTRGMEAALPLLEAGAGLTAGEILEARDPEIGGTPDRVAAVLTSLSEFGLADRYGRGVGAVWRISDAGKDWLSRMTAPQTEWPEPDFL